MGLPALVQIRSLTLSKNDVKVNRDKIYTLPSSIDTSVYPKSIDLGSTWNGSIKDFTYVDYDTNYGQNIYTDKPVRESLYVSKQLADILNTM